MSTSSAELLTRDKVSPLLKKPDCVILIVDFFEVQAVKVVKGKIKQTAVAKGIDQAETCVTAIKLLKSEAGRLPKSLIISTYEAALTTVAVTFSSEVSWMDANQALTWQLNEIITDIFPTPKTNQIISTTNFLDGDKLQSWKKHLMQNPNLPSVDQDLIMLNLATEDELERMHKRLEYIAPQSLEQLHLGWKKMAGEETAVIAIRKEVRLGWLKFAKTSGLKLKAILPLTLPNQKNLAGSGHFSKIAPAKVSSYYFEKGVLHEVRDHLRPNTLLPEGWVLGLNSKGEAEQQIFCSHQDAALLARYLPEDTPLTIPHVMSGEEATDQIVENVLHFASLPPSERSMPIISPLEPLPPFSKRRVPYYAGAAVVALGLATFFIKPALKEKAALEKSIIRLEAANAKSIAETSKKNAEKSKSLALEDELKRLSNILTTGQSSKLENTQLSEFSKPDHQRNLLEQIRKSVTPGIILEKYTSNQAGELSIRGSSQNRQQLQEFAVPLLESLGAYQMPTHVVEMLFDEPNYNYKFAISKK